jgi:hypothetical protein
MARDAMSAFLTMYPADFFYEHAGYSYDPANETPEQGRRRGAEELARASLEGFARHWSAVWEIDPDITSRDWDTDSPEHETWVCYVYDEHGEPIGSLGGVDFGPDGDPTGDPYARVVEAELAAEHLQELARVVVAP